MTGFAASVLLVALSLAAPLALTSCAARGPRYVELRDQLGGPAEGRGWIYVYRDKERGPMQRPKLLLNGRSLGKSHLGSFTILDRPPGTYRLTVESEGKKSLMIELEAGQTRFVRLEVERGLFFGRFHPRFVSEPTARRELRELVFIRAGERKDVLQSTPPAEGSTQ